MLLLLKWQKMIQIMQKHRLNQQKLLKRQVKKLLKKSLQKIKLLK